MGIFMFFVVPLMFTLLPVVAPLYYLQQGFEAIGNFFANLF